jgi:hypothetical protein
MLSHRVIFTDSYCLLSEFEYDEDESENTLRVRLKTVRQFCDISDGIAPCLTLMLWKSPIDVTLGYVTPLFQLPKF